MKFKFPETEQVGSSSNDSDLHLRGTHFKYQLGNYLKCGCLWFPQQLSVMTRLLLSTSFPLHNCHSMAMCGNHIKRVKIVINDTIIEQVTDFKYLGYRISEYRSDLEDKLQTYNKIIGAIRRHFGKQMNKETKLRIHNITAKAALNFGSEAWVPKKREEQRLEAAQMKFLRHLLGITNLDKERNQCIRGKNGSTEHSKGNKIVPEKVAATRTEDGHK